jgi:hypothetical protein
MRGQLDRHVQSWVEDRARVVALLSELSRLKVQAHVREWRSAMKASAETVVAVSVGVRADNETMYVSVDDRVPVNVL